MTLTSLGAKVVALKGVIGAAIVAAGLVVTLVAYAKVPGKIDTMVAQHDSLVVELTETNHLLRQSLCIQARVDTPAGCLLK